VLGPAPAVELLGRAPVFDLSLRPDDLVFEALAILVVPALVSEPLDVALVRLELAADFVLPLENEVLALLLDVVGVVLMVSFSMDSLSSPYS